MKDNGRVLFAPCRLSDGVKQRDDLPLMYSSPRHNLFSGFACAFVLRLCAALLKVYLPYCWGLVNTVSQPVRCQHPFFFMCLTKPSVQAVSHHHNPSRKVSEGERGEKEICVTPGGSWTRQNPTKLSPPLRRGYRFETRHLTCAYVSSVESAEWEEENRKH